jgi:hypothetical protein
MMMNNIIFSAIILAAQINDGSAETLVRRRLAGVPVGSTACLTEEHCLEQFTSMRAAGVLTGYFYADSDFPTKGCVLKGGSVYFGSGGTVEEMFSSVTGKKERLWCESTPVELDTPVSTGMADVPMPSEVSELRTPMGLTDLSMPLETSEMSMSLGLTDTSMLIMQSEMSMSMELSDISMPLETSEMSMSLGLTDTSILIMQSEMSMSMGLTDRSMPIQQSEMIMSIGTTDMSMPIQPIEMSMSIGMTEMSAPLETSDMSMLLGLTDTSMLIIQSEMSMLMGLTDVSMSIQQSEMIMSIGMTDMSMPIQPIETIMSIGMTEMSVPLETSEMNVPEANAASVSPSSAPHKETADAADTNPVTGFFENINVTSATVFFDNITFPLGNFSSGDDATKEPATVSGATALSTWSHIACFISVKWYLFLVGGQI